MRSPNWSSVKPDFSNSFLAFLTFVYRGQEAVYHTHLSLRLAIH
jgi:hypothetical protein